MLVSYIRRIVLWRVTRPTSCQTRLKTLHFSRLDPHCESGLAYLKLAYISVSLSGPSFFFLQDRRKEKKVQENCVLKKKCAREKYKWYKNYARNVPVCIYMYIVSRFSFAFLHIALLIRGKFPRKTCIIISGSLEYAKSSTSKVLRSVKKT